MTFRGRVRNGVVVIEGPESPPEGTQVEISVVDPGANGDDPPPLSQRYRDMIGILDGLAPDASERHDDYLDGAPGE